MRAGHDPADCDCFLFGNHFLDVKVNVGERVSGVGHSLAQGFVIQRLAVPWVSRIAENVIGIGYQTFQVAEVAAVPDLGDKLGEYCFHVSGTLCRLGAQARLPSELIFL